MCPILSARNYTILKEICFRTGLNYFNAGRVQKQSPRTWSGGIVHINPGCQIYGPAKPYIRLLKDIPCSELQLPALIIVEIRRIRFIQVIALVISDH